MFPSGKGVFRIAAFVFGAIAVSNAVPAGNHPKTVPSIQHVRLLRSGSQVEIEIESSAPVIPQTNELGGPDRLLLDFVNASAGSQLRGLSVNRPEVKGVRVSLFSADPPVTRIVLDLNGPQPYQVFPSGRTTIVKIGTPGADTAGVKASSGNVFAANDPGQVASPAPSPPKPSLEVSFDNGLLSITSDRASLSEILFAVHQRTGAQIAIPPGADQEKVAVNLKPAPAAQVLSQLLNGSKFNFLILSSANDPNVLDQVILSPRAEGPAPAQPPSPQPQAAASEADEEPPPLPPPPPHPRPGFRQPFGNPTLDNQNSPPEVEGQQNQQTPAENSEPPQN
jgi:AMIN domain